MPELKKHPFFKGFDWTKLTAKEIPPPLVLRMDDEEESEELQYLK